ncbi:hypothetical protein M407DRAFT_30995 [Tulasnella calospora MUT 4182]|uniref:Uncharacterized protein n=1 Tax=Tulasnella calospora MUT 4182 TaxID=1051891 RepID=A0A0C3PWH0_9AGAM|nr:hypothetical protein M407DRAFT_30995 [Tulasnella calospora MUT 4182]
MPPKRPDRGLSGATRRSTRLNPSTAGATTTTARPASPKKPKKKTPAATATSPSSKKKAIPRTKKHSTSLSAPTEHENPQATPPSTAALDNTWGGIHFTANGSMILEDSADLHLLGWTSDQDPWSAGIEVGLGEKSTEDLDGMELSDRQETLAKPDDGSPPTKKASKRKRGRPRKERNPSPSPSPLAPPLPLPLESPMPPRAEFRCDHNGVSKTVRLDYYTRWEDARPRFLDAMNIAPLERAAVRIGCRSNDARATESPTAIDEALEWDDVMKTLRTHRNACARNAKLKPKEPITVLDITAPVVDKTAPAKLANSDKAKGKGRAIPVASEQLSLEPATMPKKMKIEDALTILRTVHRCDLHDRCCRIVPPRRVGERPQHVPWTLTDLTTWARYMVAGLTDENTPPPEVQRTQQEEGPAEPKHQASKSRHHGKHSKSPAPLSDSGEDSDSDGKRLRKAPRLGLDFRPHAKQSSSSTRLKSGHVPPQATFSANPQDYPLTALFLSELEDKYKESGDFEFKKFAYTIGRDHGLVRINHIVAAGGDSISAHWLAELVDGLDLGTAQIIWDEAGARVRMIESDVVVQS